MEVDHLTVDREKTAPFLIRTFVKIGGFHRLNLFQDGTLPTTDEQQLFTWKDATLREVLTSLRNTAPRVPEYRHPLARYSFRTVYADPTNKGMFSQKDLGMVYSRDILGEPGTVERLLQDDPVEPQQQQTAEPSQREKEERTLDELRFIPGDYLLVAVILPKNVTLGGAVAAASTAAGSASWKNPGRGDTGWSAAPSLGRGGGHWRGSSDAPPPPGPRGRGGGRGGDLRDRDRDRDGDRRVPPPRRGADSPPPRSRGGWGARGGRDRARSRSPSRSPPRRRR